MELTKNNSDLGKWLIYSGLGEVSALINVTKVTAQVGLDKGLHMRSLPVVAREIYAIDSVR
jgi:hypothetical protein